MTDRTSIPWVEKRSQTLSEIVHFMGWSFRRLFSRERRLGTLLLIVAIVASPFAVIRFGGLGWAWAALTALVAVGFLIILLISYLRVGFELARRQQSEAQAAALRSSADEGRRDRARLEAEIAALGSEHALALAQIVKLNAERLSIVGRTQEQRAAGLEASLAGVGEKVRGLEVRGASLQRDLAISAAALRQDVDSSLIALKQDVDSSVSILKQDLDSSLVAMAQHVEDSVTPVRQRLESSRAAVQDNIRQLEARLTSQTSDSLAALGSAVADRLDGVERSHHAVTSELARVEQTLSGRAEADKADVAAALLETGQALDAALQERSAAARAELARSHEELRAFAAAAVGELRDDIARHRVEVEGLVSEPIQAVRAEVAQRMGEDFEARLDAWRARLDNEITSIVQAGKIEHEAAAKAVEAELRFELGKLEQDLRRQADTALSPEQVEATIETHMNAWRSGLDEDISGAIRTGQAEGTAAAKALEAQMKAELARLEDELGRQGSALSTDALGQVIDTRLDNFSGLLMNEVDAKIAAASERAQEGQQAIEAQLQAVGDQVASVVQSDISQLRSSLAQVEQAASAMPENLSKLEKSLQAVEARSVASAQALRKLSDSNASIARPFDRLLAPEILDRFQAHWLNTFGLSMGRTALAYMAHKICLLEDRGEGRIAAPIETIIMRQLAVRSLGSRDRLEVMEIGTLFGLGAAVMYTFRGSRASGMNLTLIDPLEGDYEAGATDPGTGIEVSEAVVRKNLASLDVRATDFRIIKGLSTDPEAIEAASDRLYDLILVDGDHSTAGVKADFETYGPLVKPGGLIVFDDYGSATWPGIQPYVDETVRNHPDWIWIGGEYRTAILAKHADGATAKIRAPASRRPRAKAGAAKSTAAKKAPTKSGTRRT